MWSRSRSTACSSRSKIYWTGASCTGSAFLNSGGVSTAGDTIFSRLIFYSQSANSLMRPTDTVNGLATSGTFTSATIENPACGIDAGSNAGYALTPITRAAAGLPTTIVIPLRLE